MSEQTGVGGTSDEVFGALADERRRLTLAYLRAIDGSVPIPELGERLVAADRVETSDKDDVVTALYHVHVPKLADAGLLEWDDRGVTTTDRGESLPAELPWVPPECEGGY